MKHKLLIIFLITVVILIIISGVAWTYLSGFGPRYNYDSVVIPPNGIECENGEIWLVVTNIGMNQLTQDDFSMFKVYRDGYTDYDVPLGAFTIDSEYSKEFTFNCGEPCSPGDYTVHVGISTSVQNIPVTCE